MLICPRRSAVRGLAKGVDAMAAEVARHDRGTCLDFPQPRSRPTRTKTSPLAQHDKDLSSSSAPQTPLLQLSTTLPRIKDHEANDRKQGEETTERGTQCAAAPAEDVDGTTGGWKLRW